MRFGLSLIKRGELFRYSGRDLAAYFLGWEKSSLGKRGMERDLERKGVG